MLACLGSLLMKLLEGEKLVIQYKKVLLINFCSDNPLVSDFTVNHPLRKSDHVPLVVDLNLFQPDKNHCHNVDDLKRNWSKTSKNELLKMSFDINWEYSQAIDHMSVEDMWEEIHGKLTNLTDRVPELKPVKQEKIDNYNMPWINSSLKRAIKMKNKAWSDFDTCPNITTLNTALFKQDNFENLQTKARLKYEKVITNDLKHNSKAFYSYLRNRRKVKSIVTTLSKDKQLGCTTQNDFETAECFAEAFSSVFVQEPFGPLPECCYQATKTSNYDANICIFGTRCLQTFKIVRYLQELWT